MEEALNLDRPWSIGESAFEWIVSCLGGHSPKTIVEFGSGVSSVRLAQGFPQAHLLSIENDEEQHKRTVHLRDQYLREGNLEVSLRPLVWQRHYGSWYSSYRQGPFPDAVDAVIIDGPPWWVHRGREACLYQVVPHLVVGGLVILDDCFRHQERRSAANWDRVFRGQFTTQVVDVGHGLCVMERIKDGDGAIVLRVLLENYGLLGRRVVRRVRRVLGGKAS